MEEWRSIKSYEGIYEVSSWGRVRSVDRVLQHANRHGFVSEYAYKGKMMKFGKRFDGHLEVKLCKNGKYKTYKVHRLVAEAFIPNPDNMPIINHKDENPANNHVSNLEWCDYQYNNTYGKMSDINQRTKGYRVMHLPTGREFRSVREAARTMHVGYRTIWTHEEWKVNP